MKKLHITATVLLLTAALLLGGCSKQTGTSLPDTDSGISSEIPDSNSSSENSGNSDNSDNGSASVINNEITAMFETPNGDKVDLTNAVVNGINGDMSLSEINADNWICVTCDYVYLAEPLGIYYNSVDNADIFDENECIFAGAPDTAAYQYKKYKVGDTFGDLKLVGASTSFCPEWFNKKPRYFNGGFARFEGTLTLTGKCYLNPVTEVYDTKRDIHFIPDAKGAKLPIMNYSADENGNEALCIGMNNGFYWMGEYSSIVLGNADDYSNLDFGEFPNDGSLVNVKVTIENILFRNELNFRTLFRADLVDLVIIS